VSEHLRVLSDDTIDNESSQNLIRPKCGGHGNSNEQHPEPPMTGPNPPPNNKRPSLFRVMSTSIRDPLTTNAQHGRECNQVSPLASCPHDTQGFVILILRLRGGRALQRQPMAALFTVNSPRTSPLTCQARFLRRWVLIGSDKLWTHCARSNTPSTLTVSCSDGPQGTR